MSQGDQGICVYGQQFNIVLAYSMRMWKYTCHCVFLLLKEQHGLSQCPANNYLLLVM